MAFISLCSAYLSPCLLAYVSPCFEGRSKAGLYGDVVESLDWSLREIIAALDENDLTDNTLIILLPTMVPGSKVVTGIYVIAKLVPGKVDIKCLSLPRGTGRFLQEMSPMNRS